MNYKKGLTKQSRKYSKKNRSNRKKRKYKKRKVRFSNKKKKTYKKHSGGAKDPNAVEDIIFKSITFSSDPIVKQLMAMGFNEKLSVSAVRNNKGLNDSMNWALDHYNHPEFRSVNRDIIKN